MTRRRRVYRIPTGKHGVVTWVDGDTCLVDFDDGPAGCHLPARELLHSIAPEPCDTLPSDCNYDTVDLGEIA